MPTATRGRERYQEHNCYKRRCICLRNNITNENRSDLGWYLRHGDREQTQYFALVARCLPACRVPRQEACVWCLASDVTQHTQHFGKSLKKDLRAAVCAVRIARRPSGV